MPLASLEQLETMSETTSMYVAAVLEKQYGVPEIKTAPPYGYDWTDLWLHATGKATNREETVEKLVSKKRRNIKEEIETFRPKLSGVWVWC